MRVEEISVDKSTHNLYARVASAHPIDLDCQSSIIDTVLEGGLHPPLRNWYFLSQKLPNSQLSTLNSQLSTPPLQPVDIKEFFELSVGKWFSQKTSHHLTLKQSEHGKSDLVMSILPTDDSQVIQLCQQAGIEPSQIVVSAKYTWKGTMQWDAGQQSTTNQQGESIAIIVPDTPGASIGKLFRSGTTTPVAIKYSLGEDDALTLITEDEHHHAEERVWFESNNVRLRTTIVSQPNGDAMASFYSEIRMGGN